MRYTNAALALDDIARFIRCDSEEGLGAIQVVVADRHGPSEPGIETELLAGLHRDDLL